MMNHLAADNVLVVDDDFRTRLFARSALEPSGFAVQEAASGDEALAQIDSYTPDLILLDLIMPGMDGIETCHAVRRHLTGADIPILIMTGLNDMETITSAYEAGATDFLIKPVHWPLLPRRIAFMIRAGRTTRALKESENRFRSIMELTPSVAVQGYTLGGITTYWNKFSEVLYGYTKEEALGKNLLDLIIPSALRQHVLDAMTWMVANRQPIPACEMELMRKDGSLVTVYSSHALLQPPGKELELFCMDLDLTTRQQTERALRIAKDAAEAANTAKSNFLATMSHEIRTPLSALMGNLELLEKSALAPQQKEYLSDCSTASKMLLQVINDVLDYSKIEAGKIELVNVPFSIVALGRQLVRIFTPIARKKGLVLSFLQSGIFPEYINADQFRISQIIANLLSNAIKFTNQGRVVLEISCEQERESSAAVLPRLGITVRDTGIGIPVQGREKIFESFSQLESFEDRHFSGSGLGLAICKHLAELMDGSITLTSVPGQGSVFHVSLPAVICAAPVLPEQKSDQECVSRTILLADDDDLGRTMMTSLLKAKGHQVTAVENGVQLLDMLPGNNFDLILTDISMPDIDGIKVTRIIRSGERPGINPRIPIVAITAHAFSKDKELFLAAGIDGFAPKPIDIEALQQQIEEICSKTPPPAL
jgi:two-component system, sensor histidine kinase